MHLFLAVTEREEEREIEKDIYVERDGKTKR